MSEKTAEHPSNSQESKESAVEHKIEKYDFSRAERLLPEQMSVLTHINEIAANKLAKCLNTIFQNQATVEPQSINERTIAELQKDSWEERVLAVFDLSGQTSGGLLSVESGFALALLDCILGGNRNEVAQSRPLTDLERQLFAEPAIVIFDEYAKAWSKLCELAPQIGLVYSAKSFPDEIFAGTSRAVVTTFSAQVGQVKGKIEFYCLLPASDKFLAKMNNQRWAAERSAVTTKQKDKIGKILEQVDLPVRVVLGNAKVPVADVADISVGDIICLDAEKTSMVEVWTAGKPAFNASPVTIDGQVAVCIANELCRGGE